MRAVGWPADRTGRLLGWRALWARRKFYEAAKLAPRELLSARIVAGIDELFAVDAQARTKGLDLAQRHALGGQRAPSLLAELRDQIEQARGEALPASALGRAAGRAMRWASGPSWCGFSITPSWS